MPLLPPPRGRRDVAVAAIVLSSAVLLPAAPDTRPTAAAGPPNAPVAATAPATRPAGVVAKPPTVTREAWGSKPKPIGDDRRQVPRLVTIHHAGVDWKPGGDPAEFVRNVQAWGQRRAAENAALPPEKRKPNVEDWPDLPYHFMIAPDGRIFEARPVTYKPQSNTRYALSGHLGVELMGNFQTQRPSKAQLDSCARLVAWLCQEHGIDPGQIAGHKDRAVGQTTCPGKDFDRYLADGSFVGWVRALLAGKEPAIAPGPPLPGGPTVGVDPPAPATAATRPAGGEGK